MAEIWSDEDMAKLEEFGMRYLNGQFPTWFYRVWLTVTTVPLHKTIARTAVRPIGIRPSLSRAIHKVVTRSTRPAFTKYFEPQQVVLSQAGAAKLVMGVRCPDTGTSYCFSSWREEMGRGTRWNGTG